MFRISNLFKSGSGPGSVESDATEFLKWSMDRYAAMKWFQAEVAYVYQSGQASEETPSTVRTIVFAAPNRFKLVSDNSNGFSMTSVCDGKTHVEYSNKTEQEALMYPAPGAIASSASMYMNHPMFCGTLLYQFFLGGGGIEKLIDPSKPKPRFLEVDVPTIVEPTKLVAFYGRQLYGNMTALISQDTGLVYRLTYDSAALHEQMNNPEHKKQMRRAMAAQLAKMEPGPNRDDLEKFLEDPDSGPSTSLTTETYENIRVDEELSGDVFDVSVPVGTDVRDMNASAQPKPPVPLGEQAPDFEVVNLDGTTTRLSDLRGKAVLIDFWATWCGPCRKGLPETDRLAKLGPDSGLSIMAITNEPASMVSEFLAEEGFTFPCYIDEGGKAQKLYRPPGIPAVVIVDRDGRLTDYFVGLQDPKTIHTALKKVGVRLNAD